LIGAYLLFLFLGTIAFFAMVKARLPIRIGVALAIFVIPSIALTVWVVRVGDRPSPGAIIVAPEQLAVPGSTDSTDSD
jgi:hypothetical protein